MIVMTTRGRRRERPPGRETTVNTRETETHLETERVK